MRRRGVVGGVGALVAGVAGGRSFPGAAQSREKSFTVGYLGMTPAASTPYFDLFRDGLRDLGWIEGRNLAFQYRSADGHPDRFAALAAELVALKVDVIVALVPAAVLAARKATPSIPIVMVAMPDPVEMGLVASLARPGGNLTGVTTLSADMSAKQLDLLRQLVPGLSRIAVIANPTNPWHPKALRLIEASSGTLGLAIWTLGVRRPEEFDDVVAEAVRGGSQALLVLADPMILAHCSALASRALANRLPAMCPLPECLPGGGLASYWPNLEATNRRAAWYVDRILRGAKPGDLPIEQPEKLDLTVNLKAARALGLAIPEMLLMRAAQVIE